MNAPLNASGLRVAKANLSDEELAAVVAVLTAAGRAPAPPRPSVDITLTAGWKSYWRTVRAPFHPGTSAWRNSFR